MEIEYFYDVPKLGNTPEVQASPETIPNTECAMVRQVTLRHRQDNGTEQGSDCGIAYSRWLPKTRSHSHLMNRGDIWKPFIAHIYKADAAP